MKIRTRLVLILCGVILGGMPLVSCIANSHIERTLVSRSEAQPDAPQLRRLANGHYRVRKPWTVTLNGQQWHIPKGYDSNGITAPAGIKKAIGDGITYPETWAAVFHDWLFTQPGISRNEADQQFHDLLIAYGVSSEKAAIMYDTVRTYSLFKGLR